MQRLPRFILLTLILASFSFMAFFSQGASAQDEATPTFTPAPLEDSPYAFDWGMIGLPTQEQIDEALACNAGALAIERFEGLDLNDPATSYLAPETACDWAAMALAYTNMLEDENTALPDTAWVAFTEMVRLNPALAFQNDVFTAYMHRMGNLVDVPALVENELTALHVEYSWFGLGIPGAFDLTFALADGEWTVTGTQTVGTGKGEVGIPEAIEPVTVDAAAFEGWGASLSDLLPIQNPLNIINCTDNFPNWKATLTFADGTELVLDTNGSANLGSTGIWQTEIDEQLYAQYSPAFYEWLNGLLATAGFGEESDGNYYCMGSGMMFGNTPLIDLAFGPAITPTATP